MAIDKAVLEAARAAFPAGSKAITLGAVVHDGQCGGEPLVGIPLSMMNRHGLIAGATGTGKTKTLQLIAEQLSAGGVPVFLADIKGDVSGDRDGGCRRTTAWRRVRRTRATTGSRRAFPLNS